MDGQQMLVDLIKRHESVKNVWHNSRFRSDDNTGFYESYFQRANHPTRPLAFWIRYTVFSPRGHSDEAVGELWAIHFDGETGRNTAVKKTVPISECNFSPLGLDVHIGNATLTADTLEGRAASAEHSIDWTLRYAGDAPPLLLLPEPWYERSLPKAKALVGTPNAVFNGNLTVDGDPIAIDGWRGSQNHNWGQRHTDHYAWGQVAGFDNAPEAFLECSTVQIKVGPLWTPRLTFLVLRDEGEEIAINSALHATRAAGSFDFITWRFDTRNSQARVHGGIRAPARAFVGLRYENPPGGEKTCLNTKLASAEITVERRDRPSRTLTTSHRAAFEILTDRADHSVPIIL